MKKKVTFLMAAVMLLTMMVLPGKAVGQVASGTTYSTPSVSGLPTGWTGSDGGGTSYIKLTASDHYIQTASFTQTSITSIVVKARKFGGPSTAQAKITVSWYNNNNETVLGTIDPSDNNLNNYTISTPTSTSGGTGYVKIQCNGAGSSKGSGVSEVTITYSGGATYTVTYNNNGGSGTMTDPNSPYGAGATVTTLENTFTRSGYEFSKWNTANDGSGSEYAEGATFTIAANTILYAQWVPEGSSNTKTLTFDMTSNPGGWPTTNSTTLTNYTYTLNNVDYTFALKNVKCNSGYLMMTSTAVLGLPRIQGYKLTKVVAKNSNGCSTSTRVGISSSSSSASYITGGEYKIWSTQGSSYTYNLTSTASNTMYYMYVTSANAQVIELKLTYEPVTHTLTYSAINGSISGEDANGSVESGANVIEGGTVTLTATPSSGYAFSSWSVSGTGSTLSSTDTNQTTFTMGTANATVTANFISTSVVTTPTFLLPEGTYNTTQTVEISCATEGATIYYTTDGSTPSTSSSVYTSAIGITQTTTLKAFAVKSGATDSNVASAIYTLKCVAPTFSPAAGTFTDAQSVTLSCTTEGASIKYSTNSGSTWLDYSTPIAVNTNTTLQAKAVKTNWSDSDVEEAVYYIKVKTPTFSPVAGAYNEAQNVTLSCATDGATIKYSTDDGANWNTYSSAINVSETTTIKAKAEKTGLADSDVASATYTIVTVHDVAWALTHSGENGVYVRGKVSRFHNTSIVGDGSNYRYYISDDGESQKDASHEVMVYKGKNQNNQNFSNINDLVVGDEIIITGNLTTYSGYVEFNSGNHLAYIKPVIKKENVELSAFSYSHGNGPSAAQSFTVRGRNLTENLTVTASDDYEICETSDGTYLGSLSLSTTNSTTKTIYVRMKAGKGIGTHNGTITMTSADAVTQTIDLEGSVSGYTVTYAGNGNTSGSVPTDATVYEKNAEVTVLGKGDLAKTGYEFAWWENANEDLFEEGDKFYITGNTTLTAQWVAETYSYTITKTGDDASATAKLQVYNESTSTYVDAGDKIACDAQVRVVVTPSQTYYTYTLSSNDVEFGEGNVFTMPAKSITITVTTHQLYTITYPGSYSNGSVTTAPESAYADASVTIETEPATNYELTGITCANITPTIIDNNITFLMPKQNITITAITFSRKVYTVTYSVNGETTVIDADNVDAGEEITLPGSESIPAISGFTFAGWTKSTDVDILPNQYTPTATCTLYAVYSKTGQTVYKLVESDLGTAWAGDYLIAYNDETFADGRIGGKDDSGSIGAVGIDVDPEDNLNGNKVDVTWGDTYNVTLEEIATNSNTYLLVTKDGKYNYQTNNSNGLSATATRATAEMYPLSITFTSNNGILIKNSAGAGFRYNSGNGGFFRFYKDCGQNPVYLYKKQTMVDYYTSVITGNTPATANINTSETGPIYIKSGNTLDMGTTYTITNTDPAKLVIEDGGQLILSNSNTGVQATVRKTTAASSAKVTSAWNAISSSVDNVEISTFIKDESGSQNQHNVYRYDEATVYWQEYRNTSNAFSNLTNGRGYLYRSLISGVEFSGDVNTGNIDCTDFLSWSCDEYGGRYKGFNLIGNPFTHDITWSNITNKENISGDGYYTLKSDGTWNTQTTGGTIAPMQAFLIQATGASPKLKIANTVGKGDDDKFGGDQIMFNVENSEYSDVAYVLFKKGHGLNKIEHRNDKTPMLYIINEDGDYAIADMPDNTSVINLGFEAKTMGQYTFSLKAEGRYSYMHLIDKLTGEDVDMLIEDSYTFMGSPRDRKDRFVLRLNYNAAGIDTESSIFAYQSGSDILVSGEGELQIFDVMGRMVMNQRINGVETINGINNGVYIFKLEGKTQKIVVR